MQPIGECGNWIELTLGYPSSAAYTGDDPRSDPRVIDVLEQAGKLKRRPRDGGWDR